MLTQIGAEPGTCRHLRSPSCARGAARARSGARAPSAARPTGTMTRFGARRSSAHVVGRHQQAHVSVDDRLHDASDVAGHDGGPGERLGATRGSTSGARVGARPRQWNQARPNSPCIGPMSRRHRSRSPSSSRKIARAAPARGRPRRSPRRRRGARPRGKQGASKPSRRQAAHLRSDRRLLARLLASARPCHQRARPYV